ncbi:MAG: hypothetical protein R8L53_04940 [Mariprofundales bacterium]
MSNNETDEAKQALSIGDGATNNVINMHQNIVQKKVIKRVELKRDAGHINSEQAANIKRKVDDIAKLEIEVNNKKNPYGFIYKSLSRHCKVESYRLIAANDYKKASKYLDRWLASLYRNANKQGVAVNTKEQRQRIYTKIHVNLGDDGLHVTKKELATYLFTTYNKDTMTLLPFDQLMSVQDWVLRINKKRSKKPYSVTTVNNTNITIKTPPTQETSQSPSLDFKAIIEQSESIGDDELKRRKNTARRNIYFKALHAEYMHNNPSFTKDEAVTDVIEEHNLEDRFKLKFDSIRTYIIGNKKNL